MKRSFANRIAIAIALGLDTKFLSAEPPKLIKTQSDFNNLIKAEEKRARKAQKRIKEIVNED